MSTSQPQRSASRRSHSAAVAVRLVAFVVATVALGSVPAILFAASTGRLTSATTLITVGGAALVVAVAAFAARSVDPFRG